MLSCLAELPFEPHPYQINTAARVVNDMNCRALIADEVGLGKTVEAGLVIREIYTRNNQCKILILTPASLVQQWWCELMEKFGLNFNVCRKAAWGWDYPLTIGSLDKAKRGEHKEALLTREYDLIIIDEAHKLKNRKTENWKFVASLRTQGLLLLTATPMQNQVEEVFNLVSLIKPETFNDYTTFLQHHQLNPKALISDLKDKLSDVMIRNLTRDHSAKSVTRQVQLVQVDMWSEEIEIYQDIENLGKGLLTLALKKEFCSSMPALYTTLQKKGHEGLCQKLESVRWSKKIGYLDEIIKRHPGKIIIFTEYLYTQYYIAQHLNQENITFLLFNGKLRRNQKDYIRYLFQNQDYRILICTDSGSQGLNLQFSDVIVNYDLPWNPMKVEQRIGRIDRIGQASADVHIYNFVLRDTIEERIFQILGEKISLFKECIGDLDSILVDEETTAKLEQSLFKL